MTSSVFWDPIRIRLIIRQSFTKRLESHFVCCFLPLSIKVWSLILCKSFEMLISVDLRSDTFFDYFSSSSVINSLLTHLLIAWMLILIQLMSFSKLCFASLVKYTLSSSLKGLSDRFSIRSSFLTHDIALLDVVSVSSIKWVVSNLGHHLVCFFEHLWDWSKATVFEERVIKHIFLSIGLTLSKESIKHSISHFIKLLH